MFSCSASLGRAACPGRGRARAGNGSRLPRVEDHAIDITGTDENHQFLGPRWEARETISFQSPLGFHVLDAWNVVLQNRPVTLSPAQGEEIRAWFAAKRERLPDNRYKGILKGRNLIVVQVDSLERFVIGRSVGGRPITPTLDGLLPNSLFFTNIPEQVNEGSSSDSDLMTNTSVYPVRKGSTFFRFPANAYNSLPRILREAGYRTTVAMHPDPAVYWNWKNGLTAVGFDTCPRREQIRDPRDPRARNFQRGFPLPGSGEDHGAPRAVLRLRGHAHLPRAVRPAREVPRVEARSRADRVEPGQGVPGVPLHGPRDREVPRPAPPQRAARTLGCGVLRRSRLGPPVLRRRGGGHGRDRGLDARSSRLVPLIVYAPGIAGERLEVTGGHIDIMPTLLYLLGFDEETVAGTAMGRNLLKTGRDFAVLADGTVVGRDAGAPFARAAVQGLAIADLAIRGNYFAELGYGKR